MDNSIVDKDSTGMISVIVPCYNTEKFIRKCIESILTQTYKNLEIILVDDGSTDNTGNICDWYASKDDRIKVLHGKNGGSSAARNKGMAIAKGDYITFVDSDDWIKKDTYKYLISLMAKYHADCALGRTLGSYEKDNKVFFEKGTCQSDKLMISNDAIKMVLVGGGGACNKLIKKELLVGESFAEGVTNEDELFMIKIYSKSKKVILGGKHTYCYRINPDSVTHLKFSIKNLDFYYNTINCVEFIKNERPELLEYAKARHYKASAYCSAKLHFHIKGADGDKHRCIIKKDLASERKNILKNQYLSLPYKVLALFCSFV